MDGLFNVNIEVSFKPLTQVYELKELFYGVEHAYCKQEYFLHKI